MLHFNIHPFLCLCLFIFKLYIHKTKNKCSIQNTPSFYKRYSSLVQVCRCPINNAPYFNNKKAAFQVIILQHSFSNHRSTGQQWYKGNIKVDIKLLETLQIQIQITLFFPEIVHNNYMGIYKINHRITKCSNAVTWSNLTEVVEWQLNKNS